MKIGDKVKFINREDNISFREYADMDGTVIDTSAIVNPAREKTMVRVAFSSNGNLGPYVDVAAWRIERVYEL